MTEREERLAEAPQRETSFREEEEHLKRTLEVVHRNVEAYGREVSKMKADIDEMLEHYHDNDMEVLTILNNTITLHDHMKRALARNEKARSKPYFGRIVFWDKAFGKEESIYIGKGGIAEDTTHQIVTDWRAPVANAYYESSLGECSYPSPEGGFIEIDLRLKRTYEIEEGKLCDFYDTEVIANDDLLTRYLAKNKQAVLGEIIATIQKEQNDIIRKSPYHNIIVQGVAGSGKTTVAMHRISFILYNYQERFKPEDFYIVGSNRILLNYITGVLPDLDVYGVRQMTMEQLFVRLLYEDWDDKRYRIREAGQMSSGESVKGTLRWFRDLERYCNILEWRTISRESIYLDRRQFVEGIQDGKAGVFDQRGQREAGPKDLVCLLSQEAIEDYIRQNPAVSIQSKINMLNERLLVKMKDEFLGKNVSYTESERKAILKAYRGGFGSRIWKKSIFEMYRDFLEKQNRRMHDDGISEEKGSADKIPEHKGYGTKIPMTEFDVYDLAALAYLYKRVKETEVISEAHHVVIDEAQDFGMMAYSVLKFCIKDCTYTIMGDVSQNIHFGYGLNDWEELKELILSGERDSFGVLKKSYRNTVEISEFATHILHHGRFSVYPVEPIIRHGDPVRLLEIPGREALLQKAAGICRSWQEKGLETIAVVCRGRKDAETAAKELGRYMEVMESDLEKAVFGNGIMVLPVEYTKGLEFDAVLILDPTREEYPVDDGHAKLLYVAATRALHELCVLHEGNLTGLIADPLPEEKGESSRVSGEEEPAELLPPKKAVAEQPKQPSQKEAVAEQSKQPLQKKAVTEQPKQPSQKKAVAEQPKQPSQKKAVAEQPKQLLQEKTAAEWRQPKVRQQMREEDVQEGKDIIEPRASVPAGRKKISLLQVQNKKKEEQDPGSDKISYGYLTDRCRNIGDNSLKKTKPPAKPVRENPGFAFGDMPATETLRPAGHGKIDLSVRWVMREPDGLYLQSRYGVLRLSPVSSNIIRVTFAKEQEALAEVHPRIALRGTERMWMYRESGGNPELTTDDLCLQADRASGALRYMTRDKKLLLSERGKESRQLEAGQGKGGKAWVFFDWQKGEKLYGMGIRETGGLPLRGSARYISHGSGEKDLPFLISDRGYGILVATEDEAVCCDIPAYGSYLMTQGQPRIDYYFISGKRQGDIMEAYARLCICADVQSPEG